MVCSGSAHAQEWSEIGGGAPERQRPAGPEIKEPFFALALSLVREDSLGTWSGDELRRMAASLGRPSKFPLDEVVSLTRRRSAAGEGPAYPEARVRARWRLELRSAQDRPMPYSILGYHPGSLRISRVLVFAELDVGDLDLVWTRDGKPGRATVTDVVVFPFEKGHILLDADGFLDALLGSALDDAWTLGFVVAREKDRLMGLGVSLGRDGRPIHGEFDFARDEVLVHGRPAASALSRASRRWLDPERFSLPTPWVESPPAEEGQGR